MYIFVISITTTSYFAGNNQDTDDLQSTWSYVR